MRLYEITSSGPDQLFVELQRSAKSGEWDDIVTALQKFDWQLEAKGHYARVFRNSSYPYVLKIFNKDKKYLEYIKWAANNQNNQFVPQIVGNPTQVSNDIYYVCLEALIPITDKSVFKKYIDPKLQRKWIGKVDIDLHGMMDSRNRKFLEQHFPDFIEMLDVIIGIGNGQIDITTPGNVLMRKNGEIVFSDPV